MASRPLRLASFTFAGLLVGGGYAAWSLASAPPDRGRIVSAHAVPPAPPACPDDGVVAQGYEPTARLGDTDARWIVRCDPRRSEFALSESTELLWADSVVLDANARREQLSAFVRSVAESNHVVLQPTGEPQRVEIAGTPCLATDVDGVFRLPALTVRVWYLPAGSHTLEARLVSSTARSAAMAAATRGALASATGLRASEVLSGAPERTHTIDVHCPDGFTDATPADGGSAPAAWLARYCLSPGDDGGIELAFTELAASVRDAGSYDRLLELAARSVTETGIAEHVVWSAREPVTVAGVTGLAVSTIVEPPPAHLRVRAVMVPSNETTLFGLSIAMREHADAARGSLDSWLAQSALVHATPPDLARARRRTRVVSTVLAAAMLSAIVALVGGWLSGPKRAE